MALPPEERRLSYGDLIRDAFRISWRNKFLWFFGFFAAGGANVFSNFTNVPSDFSGDVPGGLPGWVENNLVAIIATAVVLAVIISLIFIVLTLISTGGLSESVAALDRGEERRFGSTFRAGLSNFWRVLFQAILFFLIGLGIAIVLLVLIGLPILLTFLLTESVAARVTVGVLFGVFGFLLFIAVFIPYSIVGQFSLRALVVDRAGIIGGIRAGYGLFRRNIGKSLLVWLINLGLSLGVGVAILLVTLVLGLVFFLPTILLGVSELSTAAIVAGVFGGLLLIPVLILMTAATGTFFHAYWTIAYLRLTNRNDPEPA